MHNLLRFFTDSLLALYRGGTSAVFTLLLIWLAHTFTGQMFTAGEAAIVFLVHYGYIRKVWG